MGGVSKDEDMREHLIIAGGGQAAVQAAQSVRQTGFDGRISLVAEEPCPPYQRPPLSKKFLAGEMEQARLALKAEDFYRTRDIELVIGTRVDAIETASRKISLSDGSRLTYSKLLLATGGTPRRLAVPGAHLAGIHYLRSMADAVAIRKDFVHGARLLIIGAGYIGLEVAAVAIRAGLSVTVLEADQRAMARSVCPETSGFYADYHRRAGVDLRFGAGLKAFHGDQTVHSAETTAGERIDADLVIVGIGVTPRTELAEQAGLMIDNGIAVDVHCRSSIPEIFAAGDCVSYPHPWVGERIRLESVQNAIEQGKVAAASICGQERPFTAIPWFWSDQYDLKLQIAGISRGYDTTVIRGHMEQGSFSVFYLAGGRVIAVDAVNDPRGFIAAKQRLTEKPRWPVAAIADPDCDLAQLEA
jgi:3-phenylpropionate/trans-cinnamate dioxygenase ferredoxin reductase subunit